MTLKELAEKLTIWRNNKKSKSERIPKEYWLEVVRHVQNSEAPSIVARDLGINFSDLKKRLGLKSKNEITDDIQFQEIELEKEAKEKVIFELTTIQGISLKVYQ